MPRHKASSARPHSVTAKTTPETGPATIRPSRLKTIVSLLLLFSLAVVLVMLLIADISATAPQAPPTFNVPGAATHTPGETPEPWFYDEPNNQHWDPGHNHWHQGPPPPPEERSN